MQHQSEAAIKAGSRPFGNMPTGEQSLEELILDSVPQMIWSAGPDGIHDYHNRQWSDFTGIEAEAITSAVLAQLVHPEDRARVLEAWEHSRLSGADFEAEYRLRHRSGAYRWILDKARAERGHAGEILRWYGSCVNIESETRADAAQTSSESRFRDMLDALPQMVWTNGSDGRQTYYNRQWYEFTGLVRGEAEAVRRADLVHPEDLEPAMNRWNKSLSTGEPYEMEYRLRHHSGEYRWVLSRGVPRADSQGDITWYGTTTDINQRVQARAALYESEALNRSIIESSADSIKMLNHDGKIIFANDAALRDFGIASHAELLATPWLSVFPSSARASADRAFQIALRGGTGHFHAERIGRCGARKWYDVKITPVLGENGQPRSLVVISRDVSDQKEVEERVRWSANHDPLTELANRTLFTQRLDSELKRAGENERCLGLLLLDLDDFKQINDTLGHDAGDRLLCDFAARLRSATREEDLVARLGGDEFAIILPDIDDADSLVAAANKIMAELRHPYVHEGHVLDCRASIGASIFPDHAIHRAQLLKQADIALYVAKSTGRGRALVFEPHMRAEVQNRSSMLSLARRALDENLIVPFYQPKIDLRTGKPAGFEALLRWRHPTRGIQLPCTIAAAFEDLDLSASISDCMIEQVIEQVRRWIDNGVPFGSVAVNASAAEFRRGGFGETLLEKLHRASIPPSCIDLEVTETVFLGRGAGCVEQALGLLSKAGMRIALDDFGTGYASLVHLKQFPVDVIKIDRSFVRDLEEDPDDAAIVRAVINLGASLDIKIVAEGVETMAQQQFLIAQGCDFGQGFLYGKATPARMIPAFLSRGAIPANDYDRRNGASDGARTRDLRRDRPAL